jgi:hypothetical protein
MATTSADVPAQLPGREGARSDPTRLKLVIIAAFVIAIPFVFGSNGTVFWDGDISWHIATGHWVLSHGQVPMQEPFSYTAFGKPWIAHEWLSATVMALVYDAFGYTGLALLVTLSFALTFLIIGSRLQRWATPLELCTALMVVALVLHQFSVARPMVFLWPMLALWLETLLRAREEGRAPSWWLVPMMILWVNLHASFALGLGLTAMFALEALLESPDKLRVVRQWGAFGIACGLAALINPHGLTGALMPLGAFTSSTITLIAEFRPTDFSKAPNFEIAVMLLIGAAWWRGVRLAPVRLLLVLGMMHLALTHIRHQALFIIVTALVAAPAMTAAWLRDERPGAPLMQVIPGAGARRWFGASVIAGSLSVLSILRLAVPVTPPESDVNPIHAFAALPPELAHQPVLNEYSLGGPLILRGVKVFMDGRTDAYGDDHFRTYRRIAGGDEKSFDEAWQRWHFCWSIFPPENRPILALLDKKPAWHRIYADRFAVVHVRDGCGKRS